MSCLAIRFSAIVISKATGLARVILMPIRCLPMLTDRTVLLVQRMTICDCCLVLPVLMQEIIR